MLPALSALTTIAMPLWRFAVCLLAVAPFFYYSIAIIATLRFFARERRKKLGAFTPAISILKPVRGVDFASYENFRSFCTQDYPEYQILFCVNDLQDPAVPLIRNLIQEFPARDIQLLADATQLGSNRKVNNLALLARNARHELLLQSDGDVRVGSHYLREMAAPFECAETGVVSCLYRGVAQDNLWAIIEALGAATDFAPGVLVAEWREGATFALGASVAMTKSWLTKIGGYESLANMLADDYEIGNRVSKAGGRVLLSREVVETMYPATTFREFWRHQLRWSRTVRVCRPASHFGLLFTHGLPFAALGAVVAGSAAAAAFFFGSYLFLRLLLGWTSAVWGLRDEVAKKYLWLLPLRDVVHFAVWLVSFFSHRVHWGAFEFRLKANGEMVAVSGGAGQKETSQQRLPAS